MTLLLPELWFEELALETFDIVTVEDEVGFNSVRVTSNNKQHNMTAQET